jgi:hypothetical protein
MQGSCHGEKIITDCDFVNHQRPDTISRIIKKDNAIESSYSWN